MTGDDRTKSIRLAEHPAHVAAEFARLMVNGNPQEQLEALLLRNVFEPFQELLAASSLSHPQKTEMGLRLISEMLLKLAVGGFLSSGKPPVLHSAANWMALGSLTVRLLKNFDITDPALCRSGTDPDFDVMALLNDGGQS